VTANIPALGGGVPRTTPTKAFIYPLIPIWNLIKVPGMIQDALYRVDPQAGGFFMLAVAWFGLVGSWIISFFAGWILDLQLASDLRTARTAIDQATALQRWFDLTAAIGVFTELLIAGGAIVLVLVMVRIERRSAARDREIREAALAPPGQATATLRESPEFASSDAMPDAAPGVMGQALAPKYVPLQERLAPPAREPTPAFDPQATIELPTFDGSPAFEAAAVDAAVTTELPTFDGSVAPETPAPMDAAATSELPTLDGSPAPEPVPDATEAVDAAATAAFPMLDESRASEPMPEGTEPVPVPVLAESGQGEAPDEAEAAAQDAAAAAEAAEPPARVGPHLAVVVHGDGRIVATVDAEPEQITLEELALVAEALAHAAGTAEVTAADEAAAANGALETAARTLRDQGVATTTAAFLP
jgi:hypothetical protein